MFGQTFLVMKWNWVIQSLANFKLVDASTLAGVVEKAPTISDDLGKDAREMVSLRILESLFIQENENEAIVDTDSTQNSKISFDLSEHSEDVLQKILKESSEPMTELEKQKWNVRPFILHKRASFPKNPLQKFKEALLESSHPILESLKEQSNLEGTNVSENTNTINECDVDLNAETTIVKNDLVSRLIKNENKKLEESELPKSDHVENSTSGIIEDIGEHKHEMSIEPPVKGLEENTLMDHIEHDDLSHVSTSRIKKRMEINERETSIEPPVKGLEENTLMDNHPHLSTSGIQEHMGRSEYEINIEPPVKAVEEKTLIDHIENDNLPYISTSGIQEHIGRSEYEMSIKSPVEGFQENKLMDQIEHDNLPYISTSRIREHMGRSEHEISIEPPVKGFEENTLMDHIEHDNLPYVSTSGPSREGKTLMEDVSQIEIVTDSDISDDERTDIASKKEAFLSSQCTLSQDFSATIDCTEICLCMKCNKNGVLLVCSSDACPIRVHESCLASAAIFDENGNYFCPFCSYSREISKYLEVKGKASLARKDLQAFLSSKVKNRPKASSNKRAGFNRDISREIGDAGEDSEVNGSRRITIRGGEDCALAVPNDSLHQRMRKHSWPKRKNHEKESLVLSSVVSSHLKRPRKHEPQYTSPTIPLARRKILPWTKLEEDTLKEGVQRFPGVNNKGIPWTLILDFGKDVFDKSRTTVDLKDKWRNICKGIPENKRRNYRT